MSIYDYQSSWEYNIGTTTGTTGGAGYDIGYAPSDYNVPPWGGIPITPYLESDYSRNVILVDKGSPAKARFCIFYAVKKDPLIFCKNRKELYKEVKKLLKRREVDIKSIRIFKLIGGAKKIAKKIK